MTNLRDNLYESFPNPKDQLENLDARVSSIQSVDTFKRLAVEVDDTGRFNRAISFLSSKGGGTLKLGLSKYSLNSFVIPENVEVEGVASKDPWKTKNTTILEFTGTGVFIKINSYHNRRAKLKNVNLVNSTVSRTNSSTAVQIKLDTNMWGAAADIEKVTVFGFGTGFLHQMTYQSYVSNCQIWECGTAISFNAKVTGATQTPAASFGNANVIERTNAIQCNIGVELASDTLNTFRNCDFEKCYVGIYTHVLTGGFNKPQQHVFENCWFERNGWASDADYTGNKNPRYLICNSDMDASFNALGTNVAEIPKFINCRDDFNVFPEVPSHNTNYQVYTIRDEGTTRRYSTDDTILNLFKLPVYLFNRITAGKNNTWRDIFSVGNKGTIAKLNFNGYEYRSDTTTSGARTYTIDYSAVVKADPSVTQNVFSSTAVVTVYARRSGYGTYTAMFLLTDVDENTNPLVLKMGEDNAASILSACTITSSIVSQAKQLTVNMTGVTDNVVIKINYLPNGLMRGAGTPS